MSRWLSLCLLLVALLLSPAVPRAEPEPPVKILLPLVARNAGLLHIRLGKQNVEEGLSLDFGGDADTEVVVVGSPPLEARRTGNGAALPAPNGNTIPDYYLQLRAADQAIFQGQPTTRLRIEVEYLDLGTDAFLLQYDALSGGPFGDGRFKNTAAVTKGNSGQWRTATFLVCDAYFGNRDHGADLRISDRGDGAETIRSVAIYLLLPGPTTVHVDSCGANPWDNAPDSEAIQACVNLACDGDTVLFTSGVGRPGYRGYGVDRTIFLVMSAPHHNLTFTSTDAGDPALLRATAALKGFVMRLYPNSRWPDPGEIDDIAVTNLVLDGGQDVRRCFGDDGIENGVDDNWGSWLPECAQPGNPWCRAGTLALEGLMDWSDASQDYRGHPSDWSTGLRAEGLTIRNTECGTSLMLYGAAGRVADCTIEAGGDHVHVAGCAPLEDDEGVGDWADGITFAGPDHTVSGNTVRDPSDVGIVFFGGTGTAITGNSVQVSTGNHGMFAGIALHSWIFGDVSGATVTGNQVISQGNSVCGGTHAGINLGPHMWYGGCVDYQNPATVGNSGVCLAEPPAPAGALCPGGLSCQVWNHVAQGWTLTLSGNYVAGAQVNYLVEGLDLVGELVQANNSSGPPRMSDWEAARHGCTAGGGTDTWGTIDRAAHHPALPGWTDQRIHCER